MWKVVGASVAGTSHEAAGRRCEDACGWHVGDGVVCLAVADGAGSRPRSGQGAALAVERALILADGWGRAEALAPEACMRMIFADVRDQVAALAASEGNAIGDYAATLAVAVIAADLVCIGQVGDTIAIIGHMGQYEAAAPAPRYEYVNEANFVTDDDALHQTRFTTRSANEVDAAFLSTDGLRFKILADLVTGTPFIPFFEDLQAYASSGEANEDAVRRFLIRLDDQSGDDKTLIAAVCVPHIPESVYRRHPSNSAGLPPADISIQRGAPQ
jgi:Protein phosphatase 2C